MKNIILAAALIITLFAGVSYAEDKQNIIKAAEQGDQDAQFNLGLMHYIGEETPKDYIKARHWYKKAAEQGHPDAQNNLGKIHFVEDYKKAFHWFTKAAEQGHPDAQNNLGAMYADGRGTPQDYKKAFYWFTKAAEQGETSAQYNLALMYYKGNGTPQDYKKAYAWCNVAAINNDEESIKCRDQIASKLTPMGVEKARALSNEYYKKYAAPF